MTDRQRIVKLRKDGQPKRSGGKTKGAGRKPLPKELKKVQAVYGVYASLKLSLDEYVKKWMDKHQPQ